MSEVMRWKLKGFIPGVDGVSKALFQPWVVPAEDFDRVTAERDALQLRLNTADQRIDDLTRTNPDDGVALIAQHQAFIELGSEALIDEASNFQDQAYALGLARGRVKAAPTSVVLPELTADLRYIFGMMCFQCITYAQALRGMGHTIANKAEDEQAATIHWMLEHYLRDPEKWRTNAIAEIKAAKLAAEQQ